MNKIVKLQYQGEYRFWILFSDGESRIIDFQKLIGKGISSKLLDTEYFKLATIDSGGGMEWPNGYDFCPNFLKEYVSVTENAV